MAPADCGRSSGTVDVTRGVGSGPTMRAARRGRPDSGRGRLSLAGPVPPWLPASDVRGAKRRRTRYPGPGQPAAAWERSRCVMGGTRLHRRRRGFVVSCVKWRSTTMRPIHSESRVLSLCNALCINSERSECTSVKLLQRQPP